jgi:hypothetical protein
MPFDTIDEAIAMANDTEYGLAASVWTKNIDTALTVTRRVRAGRFWVNTTLSGGPELPIGGFKQSGWGREAGDDGRGGVHPGEIGPYRDRQAEPLDRMTAKGYDYVIVGGGSAGCVLAARLSENPVVRVLLLEAGGRDSHPLIHMPVGFAKMTTGPHTWGFRTAPQTHANNREIPTRRPASSAAEASINAEIFTRGHPTDYDRWAEEGARAGPSPTSASTSSGPKATPCSRASGTGRKGPSACRTSPTRSR